jgi:hypothetical protein
MDPFTDVFMALGQGVITFNDVVLYLREWAEHGARASALCRPREWGTELCDIAIDNAYHIAYMLGMLVH